MNEDKPINRRRFFREGLRELLKPLSNAIEPIEEAAKHFDRMTRAAAAAAAASGARPASGSASAGSRANPGAVDVPIRPGSRANPGATDVPIRPGSPGKIPLNVWLRPPGALPERQFLDTCSRCGTCVSVCPVECIQIDSSGQIAGGAPHINPDEKACIVCEGLQCTAGCPSGALRPLAVGEIRMGTAIWHSQPCLRSAGEECRICVDQCPLGSAAIELLDGRIVVHPFGCVGCGVCQQECPTNPRSIIVIPIAAKSP